MDNTFSGAGAQIAFQGLNGALAGVDQFDIVEVQIVIGQGLFWAISLDDLLVQRYKGAYRAARDADENGRYVDGARLARNAVTHGAVVMPVYQEGFSFPVQFPLSFAGFRWRPLEEVLADWPNLKQPPQAQLDSYRSLFPGLQPLVPIAMVRDWLAKAPGLGFDV